METKVVPIRKNKDAFGWMSNMYPFPIAFQGRMYKTSEALFQCLRFPSDCAIIEDIVEQASPLRAKMIAKKNVQEMIVEPQSEEDVANMKLCLLLKVSQWPVLCSKLIQTGDSFIVEDCTSHQHGSGLFWGAALQDDGTWLGKNQLGKLWMQLRKQMQDSSVQPLEC